MKKFAVVQDDRAKRVVVCENPSLIKLSSGETIEPVTGRVRRGDLLRQKRRALSAHKQINKYLYLGLTLALATSAFFIGACLDF